MPTDLELSIYRTLCWFSVFEQPITRFEIWKWLLKPARAYDLAQVDTVLEESRWLQDRLTCKNGLYALKCLDVEGAIVDRHHRFLDAMRKYRKLKRACLFFQTLPHVHTVAAANTLAWWRTTPESDIDLLIITSPRHIWSSRFLLVLPFVLSGHRPNHPHDHLVRDPFCFSFFSTTLAIQFESLKWCADDYYLAYWVKSLVPLFDKSAVMPAVSEVNRWADAVLPNARMRDMHPQHRVRHCVRFPIQWRLFEPLLRRLQQKRFPAQIRACANQDSRVIVTDDMLKFHDNDRREAFLQTFEERYALYL